MELFPYDTVRQEQDTLLEAIKTTIEKKQALVAHAPTGLGKTAAALAPALEYAIENKKIVMFLTSRLTQHALALRTVKEIREKHGIKIPVVDMIGKKHMCLQENTEKLSGKEFAEYCKSLREDGLCEYYERLKVKEDLSPTTRSTLIKIGQKVVTPGDVKGICKESGLCPYEITGLLAKDATVIIADYSYLFNPGIRDSFLNRIGRNLSDCIVIVDEGHNLPDRVKDLASEKISTVTLNRALKELKDSDIEHHVKRIGEKLQVLAKKTENERTVEQKEFFAMIDTEIKPLTHDLYDIATGVREEQQTSSAGVLASFIEAWEGPDEGYARILSVENKHWQLSYRCLDPSIITTPVFEEVSSTIIMSGTLRPTTMYAELIGLQDATMLELNSPFPDENRMNLIVPKTTTKFTQRSDAMYQQIADTCSELLKDIPGNVAVFFPSYALLDHVYDRITTGKTIFAEQSGMTREEREGMLLRFRTQLHQGAALMGVMGGSFGEGIDLPGDELRGVIIVGLPLGKPDLETKSLIDYYQEKFGKGWEYGYIFPAFTRTLQSAGRCIRSETDRGVIIFLDERYAWQQYYKCFPDELHMRVTLKYNEMITEFFGGQDG